MASPKKIINLVTLPVRRPDFTFQEFVDEESISGILLLVCAVIALVWANSPWGAFYDSFWHTELTIQAGNLIISETLIHWVNDGLMAVFFFVVGLEIKHEVLAGELSTRRQAALPIAAALGGALTPALIFSLINLGGDGAIGWGIPMATDIAFSLGILALLGSRAPTSLKIFLMALAIVDDLIAVLVIAVFYTSSIDWLMLEIGAGLLVALAAVNLLGIRRPLIYALLGVLVWIAFLYSGVHATIAGVLIALTIPAKTRIDPVEFLARARVVLDDFTRASEHAEQPGHGGDQQDALRELETVTEEVQTPLQRLLDDLHPWVAFVIMPLFALANSGVQLGDIGSAATSPIAIGVVVGLILGKQIGIVLAAWLAVRAGIGSLPEGVRWAHIYGVSWLGGIGFTMSLFIAGLAFSDNAQLEPAKLGILTASLIAGIGGWLVLARLAPTSTDEPETSGLAQPEPEAAPG